MSAYREDLSALLQALEEKRARAENSAGARAQRLKESSAEYARIVSEKESYCEKILYAMRGTPEEAQEELERLAQSHRDLRERERALLKELSLPEDYLKPQYECAACSDRGYLPGGGMCACLKRALNAVRARKSGLFSLFEKQTFQNFDPSRVSEGMRENLRHCREYADGFDPQTSTNLLFVGGTGVGKTHLSSAIGRVVLEQGHSVVYEGAMQALSAMETERFSEEKPQTERLMEADLLILDDLGTELPGKTGVSFLYLLINSRLISHRPTILSTNLSARELEARYEARLFSRLTGEYEVLVFEGRDQRGAE